MMGVKRTDLEDHPLFKARPNFSQALHSFESFLDATKLDLLKKKEALENEKTLVRNNKNKLANTNLLSYISCQLFMLKKHLSRLDGFQVEINQRILEILSVVEQSEKDSTVVRAAPTDTTSSSDSSSDSSNRNSNESLENDVDRITVCGGDHHSTCDSSGSSSGFGEDEDSFDSSVSSSSSSSSTDQPLPPLPISQQMAAKDQQLLQLLADMTKMKRRCKHILDVTDRFCALETSPCPMPGLMRNKSVERGQKKDTDDNNDDAPDGPGSSSDSPPMESPNPALPPLHHSASASSLPECISQNLVKTTLQSLGNHLVVIAKTYTRRHSNEISNSG